MLLRSFLFVGMAALAWAGEPAVPVHDVTCQDDAQYTSRLGPLVAPACTIAMIDGITSDACGRACADNENCTCATHDKGDCALLARSCCEADILTPCRGDVVGQSNGFTYIQGGVSGTAVTTRFWDCSKPSCSWPGKANVTSPPRTCQKDGYTSASPLEKSGAGGGNAYACTNQQPWVSWTDPSISYGFVAFSTPSGGEARSCCMCLELSFVDARLAGKRLVVQVVNMNPSENGKHVDIAVPGGGIGGSNGCKSQWNAGPSWGLLYGGTGSNRWECEGLPWQLRRGCRWQYDWLLDLRSDVTYHEIVCPDVLTRVSGCKRQA